MRVIDLVIVIVWVVFWAYWLFAARGVKSGRSGGWNRFIGLRVALLVVIIFGVRSWGLRGHQAGTDPVLTGIGLALFLLGLALAVWARLYIGRNWALATTLYGLIVAAVLGGFFIYSAIREEAYLTEQFQDTYRAYKHSTKMLIPFVL